MLTSFFTSKDEPAILLTNSKIIETKHNNLPCSKITLKTGSTAQYEVLKTVTHPNIIPIYKLSNRSIYTKRITPLSLCLEKDKKLYNKCLILKIRDALDFVHQSLKREHRGISLESIFIDTAGMPVLGNFEKSSLFLDSQEDFNKLDLVSAEITGYMVDQITEDKDSLDFILTLEFSTFSSLKTEEKQNLISRIFEMKNEIPLITVKNIFTISILDLEKEATKEYKIFILEKLIALNRDYFFQSKKVLFSIIDSTVRIFLLKIFTSESGESMDDIVPDLSLGLRVKDKVIKTDTIDFVFKNSFTPESMEILLENMLTCTDTDSIVLICSHLLEFEYQSLSKPIYKLLYSFLVLNKALPSVYRCLEKFYTSFDKVKISKELLPNLCSHLIEKENQEQCFGLVEKIIKFLKDHKEEIHNKEWSFKHISNIFNKKEDQKEKFEKRISKFAKEEMNEWEGSEIL